LAITVSIGAIVSQWQTQQEQWQTRQEFAARAAEIERWLQELRVSDPKAYLAQLKADGDSRWEPELQALDPQGYKIFVTERHRNEEAARKAEIAKLLAELKTVHIDLTKILALYSRLSTLDPMNSEYRLKRDEAARKLKISELLAYFKTISATDIFTIYNLYLNLTMLDPKNDEYKAKAREYEKKVEAYNKKKSEEYKVVAEFHSGGSGGCGSRGGPGYRSANGKCASWHKHEHKRTH
jgi:hypothetical protein